MFRDSHSVSRPTDRMLATIAFCVAASYALSGAATDETARAPLSASAPDSPPPAKQAPATPLPPPQPQPTDREEVQVPMPSTLPPVWTLPNYMTSLTITQAKPFAQSVVIDSQFLALAPLLQTATPTREPPHACQGDSLSLCYDYRTGRVRVRVTREWLPDIPGLRAEGVSARRDRLLFNYSFK